MLLRWLLALAALPFFAAALPVEKRELDLLGLVGLVVNPILAIITGGFSVGSSIFPAEATIRPATAGGKSIKVTGGRGIGYDTFIGIPFAEPLTGPKRFDQPPSPKVFTGDIEARKFAKACMQSFSPLDSGNGRSEDCLYLDIMTPNNVAGTDAKLPVMVWIYGGGFSTGSSALYTTLGAPTFVKRATKLGKPVIFVGINYRLGVWGFPTGKAFADAGAANNGIRDQQMALKWIQENIAAFGGDPEKVTVFGESAGSISASILLLNEQDTTFRAAIMQSGGPNTMPMARPSEWEEPYVDLVNIAGCTGKDSFACLKSIDADKLLDASVKVNNLDKNKAGIIGFLWRPLVDGDVIKEFPSKLLSEGRIAKKPFINGQNKDEATLFVDWGIKSEDELFAMINKIYPKGVNNTTFARLLEKYPNDPSLGSPFNTGTNTFLKSPVFKQASAMGTDALFSSRRRDLLRKVNQAGYSRTWSYHFEGNVPIVPGFLGVAHATDLVYMFGIVRPLLLFWTSADYAMSLNMMDYWINFANNLDPNGPGLPNWSTHDFPANKNILSLKPGQVQVVQDDFREDRISIFTDPTLATALHV